VIGFGKNGETVRFTSVLSAVSKYGMGVVNVLSGRAKTAKGFVWEYEYVIPVP